ncbi:hypothetical protein KAM469_36840 [Aeromonas caviae]|nr:hypothetical protein KAM469_36840 [Aeromonas caviae]
MPDAAPTPPSEPILLAQDYTRAGPERQWPIPPQCLTAQHHPGRGTALSGNLPYPHNPDHTMIAKPIPGKSGKPGTPPIFPQLTPHQPPDKPARPETMPILFGFSIR